jgi:hypothetical protein
VFDNSLRKHVLLKGPLEACWYVESQFKNSATGKFRFATVLDVMMAMLARGKADKAGLVKANQETTGLKLYRCNDASLPSQET